MKENQRGLTLLMIIKWNDIRLKNLKKIFLSMTSRFLYFICYEMILMSEKWKDWIFYVVMKEDVDWSLGEMKSKE